VTDDDDDDDDDDDEISYTNNLTFSHLCRSSSGGVLF
jgi:hypothetical protein